MYSGELKQPLFSDLCNDFFFWFMQIQCIYVVLYFRLFLVFCVQVLRHQGAPEVPVSFGFFFLSKTENLSVLSNYPWQQQWFISGCFFRTSLSLGHCAGKNSWRLALLQLLQQREWRQQHSWPGSPILLCWKEERGLLGSGGERTGGRKPWWWAGCPGWAAAGTAAVPCAVDETLLPTGRMARPLALARLARRERDERAPAFYCRKGKASASELPWVSTVCCQRYPASRLWIGLRVKDLQRAQFTSPGLAGELRSICWATPRGERLWQHVPRFRMQLSVKTSGFDFTGSWSAGSSVGEL